MERNGSSLALSGYAKAKHFGRLAYMPLAYKRYLEHKARDAGLGPVEDPLLHLVASAAGLVALAVAVGLN